MGSKRDLLEHQVQFPVYGHNHAFHKIAERNRTHEFIGSVAVVFSASPS